MKKLALIIIAALVAIAASAQGVDSLVQKAVIPQGSAIIKPTPSTHTEGKLVLRLMGDSTMADKDLSKQNPERGWGHRLPAHLDTMAVVKNYAQNGRSTKSFITLGLWDQVVNDLKAGEYLIIEFGHNDAKESDTLRYAPANGLYKENLEKFASYALSIGAHPVILAPVARRWFTSQGELQTDCHGDYPEAARSVAEKLGIPYIDANVITQNWLRTLGDEGSRPYYMWIEKGTSPRHPDGLADNTHTNEKGARKIVDLLLPELVKVIPGLEDHIQEYDFTVAKDGSGDFFTVQDAINAAPDYLKDGEVTIHIRPGIYAEKVTIPANKQRLHIIGDDPLTTTITWNDYARKIGSTGKELGTSATSTVFLYGEDTLIENITIENTAGEGQAIGQACAITVDADRVAFINCRFVANQDTIYTYGAGQHQYYKDCWIEGTTDFIFGYSTCWFEGCTILSKRNSYITAASTIEGQDYGYVFSNCTLIAAEGIDKVYLGRPWRPYAQTVFLNCNLGGHILPEGWHNWNKPYAEKTAFYGEYGNTGEGASIAKRVSWSHQLKAKEAAKYTKENVLMNCGAQIDKNGNNIAINWYFLDKLF